MKPKSPLVKGERVLFYEYHPRYRKAALVWLRRMLDLKKFPKYSRIGLDPIDDPYLKEALRKSGFRTKWFQYEGKVADALRNLKASKNPPRDLKHLDLKIVSLSKVAQLASVIRLQKKVFSRFPQQGNFSHTSLQLSNDFKKYQEIVRKKTGRLFGIYRDSKLVGFFGAVIHGKGVSRSAGLTFCFEADIHGKGITKTAYPALLNYLKGERVNKFYGGTSRPAIQHLAKVMKRENTAVI